MLAGGGKRLYINCVACFTVLYPRYFGACIILALVDSDNIMVTAAHMWKGKTVMQSMCSLKRMALRGSGGHQGGGDPIRMHN